MVLEDFVYTCENDCEDVFAHEIAYHTVHKWCDLLNDMLYSVIQGVPSKGSVWYISRM